MNAQQILHTLRSAYKETSDEWVEHGDRKTLGRLEGIRIAIDLIATTTTEQLTIEGL